MKRTMTAKRSVMLGAATLVFVAWYRAAFAEPRLDSKPAPVDAAQYADFMANEALDMPDLAETAECQREMFNRMTPPDFSWLQPMFPSVVPFDAANFSDSFLDGLLGEDKNSVTVYPLSLVLDPQTRETIIYNSDDKPLAVIPADKGSHLWPKDADPSRVSLQLDLLPTEDVEPYLYVEGRLANAAVSSAAKQARGGDPARRNLGAGQFGISHVQTLTNGAMQITVTNGADVAEIFAYTVLYAASNVVVSNETLTLWTPVSPSFNGLESAWECQTTNLALTNGVGVWADANISSNARVRFYGVAKRTDSDDDGLTDGAELFVHHTDTNELDTDEDGMGDGDEVGLNLNPLASGEYISVWISSVNGGRP